MTAQCVRVLPCVAGSNVDCVATGVDEDMTGRGSKTVFFFFYYYFHMKAISGYDRRSCHVVGGSCGDVGVSFWWQHVQYRGAVTSVAMFDTVQCRTPWIAVI